MGKLSWFMSLTQTKTSPPREGESMDTIVHRGIQRICKDYYDYRTVLALVLKHLIVMHQRLGQHCDCGTLILSSTF